MSNGFQVSLSALADLADAVDSQLQSFRSVGSPLKQGAGSVRTGDTALDSEIQTVVSRCDAVFGQLADALGGLADGVRMTAENYQEVDAQTAEDFRTLTTDGLDAPGHTIDSPLVG